MLSRYKRRKRVVSVVVLTEADMKEDPEVDMGMFMTANMVAEVVDPPTCFNSGEIGHVS
jgi:hypothetical protein